MNKIEKLEKELKELQAQRAELNQKSFEMYKQMLELNLEIKNLKYPQINCKVGDYVLVTDDYAYHGAFISIFRLEEEANIDVYDFNCTEYSARTADGDVYCCIRKKQHWKPIPPYENSRVISKEEATSIIQLMLEVNKDKLKTLHAKYHKTKEEVD